jgi:EAL domain-containing protein (putative c-di-GMP-specific phosphodiesterase class I)
MGPLQAPASVPPPSIDLDEALNHGWLEDWYWPKVDFKHKCLAGADAMVCVRHPGLGLLMPGGYTCAAADMTRLSEHALAATLKNWSSFDAAGFNLSLAIKIPLPILLDLPIQALVARHRPTSERWPGVVLQVNEDDIVRDRELAREITTRLRDSDIKIAIDDFGSGYSSLASLRDLPIVEIKLDRGFVQNCAIDATNGAICQTTIDLAHRLNRAAAANGIENQADLQSLMAMGCDFGQGNLISPPLSQDQFLELLHQRTGKPREQPLREQPLREHPQRTAAPPPVQAHLIDRVA